MKNISLLYITLLILILLVIVEKTFHYIVRYKHIYIHLQTYMHIILYLHVLYIHQWMKMHTLILTSKIFRRLKRTTEHSNIKVKIRY